MFSIEIDNNLIDPAPLATTSFVDLGAGMLRVPRFIHGGRGDPDDDGVVIFIRDARGAPRYEGGRYIGSWNDAMHVTQTIREACHLLYLRGVTGHLEFTCVMPPDSTPSQPPEYIETLDAGAASAVVRWSDHRRRDDVSTRGRSWVWPATLRFTGNDQSNVTDWSTYYVRNEVDLAFDDIDFVREGWDESSPTPAPHPLQPGVPWGYHHTGYNYLDREDVETYVRYPWSPPGVITRVREAHVTFADFDGSLGTPPDRVMSFDLAVTHPQSAHTTTITSTHTTTITLGDMRGADDVQQNDQHLQPQESTSPMSETTPQPNPSSWPDNDYFVSWIQSMEQTIGAPIYSNRNLGTPFIEVAPIEDFNEPEIHVDGEKLAVTFMYMGPNDEPEGRMDQFLDELQGYYFAKAYMNGIVLFVDPAQARWAEGYEGKSSDPMVPICKRLEGWLSQYEPPGPYDALFERLISTRDHRVSLLKGTLRTHASELQRIEGQYRTQMREVADLTRQIRELESFDKKSLVRTASQYEGLVRANGTLEMSGDSLVYTIPKFDLWDDVTERGVTLGPLQITLRLGDYSIHVAALDNMSIDGYPHPHVSPGGHICWGESMDMYQQVANGCNPFEMLFTTAQFLINTYTSHDAHQQLADWNGEDGDRGWYCEHHGSYHPDDEACPEFCNVCDTHVDWDYHTECTTHGCWNDDEYDECPGCHDDRLAAEEEEAERRAEQEEAERRAEREEAEREERSEAESAAE